MKFRVIILTLLLGFSSCLIEDDYGSFSSQADLGDLLSDETLVDFVWLPPSNEIVYAVLSGTNSVIKAVNLGTRQYRTISTFSNRTILAINWKNNNYQELVVASFSSNSSNEIHVLKLSDNSRERIYEFVWLNPNRYLNSIISNEKFLVTRAFNPINGNEAAVLRKWSTNEDFELGNLIPIAASPDYEQLILADQSEWPYRYFIYGIETEDFLPLLGFNNFPADIIEWTPIGIIGYIMRPTVYIRRNLTAFNELRFTLFEQYDNYMAGAASGNIFLFLYQRCLTDVPIPECNTKVFSEIYIREINRTESERVMFKEGAFFQKVNFSPDEKAVAAIVDNQLYYKKFKD
ncbi:MAG TPA: hypothetical protein PKC24_00670 [Cyclobacteriaceae bacterium]|nr:hypothetical protein [Cyclobacteriaceae bacterium]